MKIKLFMHLMPWEVDDAQISYNKIAVAKKYISDDDILTVDTCLNLSNHLIDWNLCSIPKEYFIDKYNYIGNILYDVSHKHNIYDGPDLYGHLDFQREIIESDIDYYMSICPDVYFHPHAIYYMLESAKNIKSKYFILTSEAPKLWDSSWDVLTNKRFKNDQYTNWNNQNINNIIHYIENNTDEPYVEKIENFKWAGWFDLYNKDFYEKLVPIPQDWRGYGPWDYYGVTVSGMAKHMYNVDVSQYILRNQVSFDKDIGIFNSKKNPIPYKKYLQLKEIPDQRKTFETNFSKYVNQWRLYAKNTQLI